MEWLVKLLFATFLAAVLVGCGSAIPGQRTIVSDATARPCSKRAACPMRHEAPPWAWQGCSTSWPATNQVQCQMIDIPMVGYDDFDPLNLNACAPAGSTCYGPAGLRHAYNIVNASNNRGSGMTVAVVEFWHYAHAKSDLDQYRSRFGEPACQGCLTVVNEYGQPSPFPSPPQDVNYAKESALDIQMVSAICPNCNILLVEANSALTKDDSLVAVETAEKLGADAISLSWTWGDELYQSLGEFDDHPGSVITASSGDDGAGCGFQGSKVQACQPCSFQGVVCVGGTSLSLDQNNAFHEVVWDGLSNTQNLCPGIVACATGSGCSKLVPKPSWQHDQGCSMRSESDIAADADPGTGVAVYFGGSRHTMGGTSAAAPIVAAMFALAGNTATASPATLWAHGGAAGFNAITSGTNEYAQNKTFTCPSAYVYICKAGTNDYDSYSGPTGWGSPNGLSAL